MWTLGVWRNNLFVIKNDKVPRTFHYYFSNPKCLLLQGEPFKVVMPSFWCDRCILLVNSCHIHYYLMGCSLMCWCHCWFHSRVLQKYQICIGSYYYYYCLIKWTICLCNENTPWSFRICHRSVYWHMDLAGHVEAIKQQFRASILLPNKSSSSSSQL